MTQKTDIKILQGGSIDYAHYIARSHLIRSNDTRGALAAFWQMLRATGAVLKDLTMFRGGSDDQQSARYTLDRSAGTSPLVGVDGSEGNTTEESKALEGVVCIRLNRIENHSSGPVV